MARLPSGYTKLAYIQATGSQYINTRVTPGAATTVVADFQVTEKRSSNNDIFGVVGQFSFRQYANSSYFRTASGSTADFATSVDILDRHTVKKTMTETVVDDTASVTTTAATVSKPLYLFAYNTGSGVQNYGYLKIYSCKIWDGDELVMDLTPCKNGAGTIGLYDSVGAQFLANAGTGTFTAGPEVPQGPDTPQDLAAAMSETGTVTLTWSASTGATGYRVYRDGGLLADTTQTTATAQLVPFGAALFAVSAYNGDGESDRVSLVAYFRPGQPLLYLITDRILADVDRIAQLAGRVSAGTATDAEKTEWATDLKGAYNASDLNRVWAAVAYVARRLNGYGYYVSVNPKQDWTANDIPTAGQMATYIQDVAALRGTIAVMDSTPPTPESASGLTWQEANNIEQIILDVDELLTRMAAAWFYSGDLFSGEL